MASEKAIELLDAYRTGKISREAAIAALQAAPLADLGFAQVDTHRALRKVFQKWCSAAERQAQVVKIAGQLVTPRAARAGHALGAGRRAAGNSSARCIVGARAIETSLC